MKKIIFNENWRIISGIVQPFDELFSLGQTKDAKVMLPQDAMILEERDANCKSKTQSGFYPAKSYTYTKEFDVPNDWKEKVTIIEFEGIMMKSMIYLNGEMLKQHSYGYSSVYVDVTPSLNYGEKNVLKVVSVTEELSSRWYTGAGIYRDVVLHQGGRQYLANHAVRVTTTMIGKEEAALEIEYEISNQDYAKKSLDVEITITNAKGELVKEIRQRAIVSPLKSELSRCKCLLDCPHLWSTDHPYLYHLKIVLREGGKLVDEAAIPFGIRIINVDAKHGLRINGERVKLRGACIHHDNGIIGATDLEAAWEYKIGKLKEAGFNSIRMAHNPASKSMLRVCDRLGVLVMDELTDVWEQKKNECDFAQDFGNCHAEEIQLMVDKDYNHPSVILYSIGNEIPEIGRDSGALMGKRLVNEIKKRDNTRFVTCAISGFLAVVDHLGAHMKDAGQENQDAGGSSESSAGSEKLNSVMGATQQQMMDAFSVSPMLDRCIEPMESELDVIGYNYMTARHVYENELHPDRVVVGSETYPGEIARLWKLAEEHEHIIGDFTWTGYDYIGEAGIGIFHYNPKRQEQGWYPDRLAYVGDIDLTGHRRDVSYLRERAYGLNRAPYITVERADKAGMNYDSNNWKYKNYIHSWTYPGFEGTMLHISVINGYEEVELFLNDVSLGKKKTGETEEFVASFTVPYKQGTLRAVAYENGIAKEEDVLDTADKAKKIRAVVSKNEIAAGGNDIVFIEIELTDENGSPNMFEEKEITVEVKGAGVLAGLGSANPSSEGNYFDTKTMTYDGRALAAIRSVAQAGDIDVVISMDDDVRTELTIVSVTKDIQE